MFKSEKSSHESFGNLLEMKKKKKKRERETYTHTHYPRSIEPEFIF